MSPVREVAGRALALALEATRRWRPGTREAARHYADGWAFRARARRWSDAERSAWTLQRLRRVVRQAAAGTPFWARRLRQAGLDPERDFSFDDFAALPILERADVAAHHAEMLDASVPASLRRRDGTGGSTGVPLQYWSGPEERGWRLSGQDSFMERIGLSRGASTSFLWGHHIDRRERTAWSDRVRDALTNRRWYDCFRLSPDVLMAYHAELSRDRPQGMVAYASALDALATTLLGRGLRAGYPTRCAVTGGEKLWPQQRARIEQVLAAPVYERYGCRDVGLIAGQVQGAAAAPLEVDWANVLVEPESDAPDAALIVTKLHADAMPMLRYRVGDVARFPDGSRPGSPTFTLLEVLGRQLDGLHLPDGGWVHGIGIPHLMKELPVHEFQIRQDADYRVEVLVVPTERYTPAHGHEIMRVLAENLPGLTMELREVAVIERTAAAKWRPVVSLVQRADREAAAAPGHAPDGEAVHGR